MKGGRGCHSGRRLPNNIGPHVNDIDERERRHGKYKDFAWGGHIKGDLGCSI